MEIIVGILYAGIIALGALFFIQKKKTEASFIAHQKDFESRLNSLGVELRLLVSNTNALFDELAKEVRDVLSKTASEVGGLGKHVSGLKADCEGLQKEIAEFTASIDPDVMDKFRDRISILEMSVGVRRIDSAKQNQK